MPNFMKFNKLFSNYYITECVACGTTDGATYQLKDVTYTDGNKSDLEDNPRFHQEQVTKPDGQGPESRKHRGLTHRQQAC
jgi:hypothetical protein